MPRLAHKSITIENGTDRSDEIENEQTKLEPDDGFNIFDDPPRNFLTTLPSRFQSLHGVSITVDSENPAELIELLGNILDITDYTTNMASFWFLDMLALQILRHYKDLDEYCLGVLISWLTGEIMLIQDRKYSRKEFFEEMREMFMEMANEISEQSRLLYWEEIMYENEEEETIEEGEMQETSTIDPFFALDKVIESTYDMYASELRYALVYAVFVEPIELQTYNLPFVVRMPRPVKFADKTSFNLQFCNNVKKMKALEREKKPKGKKKGKASLKVPGTPVSSLNDEKLLICKRWFILPLIDANEALQIFDLQ